ncbi:uncharacterized protein OCT59_009481 [Rhizophagus irregularis]|uniref:uncharacterized protein n=1 Tax=Rhizophagus irregularis TaxID=588596 RepID=UPI0033228260|nr:hypothetical protein OCT59_009481 [Rhizophagus irregularis]
MLEILREAEILELYGELTENFKTSYRWIKKFYELENIFNMDETPVWFDMAGNFTINPKGEKTVHIRVMGNEKNPFTVVLTCTADIPFILKPSFILENECRATNKFLLTTFAKNGIPGWQVAAGETATGNLRRARLNLNAELEISDDDNGNNVDDNDEGSDDASDNGSDDNTHNSIHDSDDSEDVSDRMRQLTV